MPSTLLVRLRVDGISPCESEERNLIRQIASNLSRASGTHVSNLRSEISLRYEEACQGSQRCDLV